MTIVPTFFRRAETCSAMRIDFATGHQSLLAELCRHPSFSVSGCLTPKIVRFHLGAVPSIQSAVLGALGGQELRGNLLCSLEQVLYVLGEFLSPDSRSKLKLAEGLNSFLYRHGDGKVWVLNISGVEGDHVPPHRMCWTQLLNAPAGGEITIPEELMLWAPGQFFYD